MENGVDVAALSDETDDLDDAAEDDGIDYSRIYTFTHANGEVATGTILDIRAVCIGIGSLPMQAAVRVAELYDRGTSPEFEDVESEDNDDQLSKDKKSNRDIDDESAQNKPRSARPEKTPVAHRSSRDPELLEETELPMPELTMDSSPPPNTVSAENSQPRHEQVEQTKIETQAPAGPANANHVEIVPGISVAPSLESLRPLKGTPTHSEDKPRFQNKPVANTKVPAAQSMPENVRKQKVAPNQSAERVVENPKVRARVARNRPAGHTRRTGKKPADIVSEQIEHPLRLRHPETMIDNQEVETAHRPEKTTPPHRTPRKVNKLEDIPPETSFIDKSTATDGTFTELVDAVELEPREGRLPVDEFYESPESGEGVIFTAPEPYNFSWVAPVEIVTAKPSQEFPLPIVDIEHSVYQLVEHIKIIEGGESEEVHWLLDEIVQTVESERIARDYSNESSAPGDESVEPPQKTLEDLFTRLFEQTGVDYTDELVRSFVELSLKSRSLELVAETEPEEDDAAHDRGTHEVIKQILVAISDTKKAAVQAYNIGRFALSSYLLHLAPVLS